MGEKPALDFPISPQDRDVMAAIEVICASCKARHMAYAWNCRSWEAGDMDLDVALDQLEEEAHVEVPSSEPTIDLISSQQVGVGSSSKGSASASKSSLKVTLPEGDEKD